VIPFEFMIDAPHVITCQEPPSVASLHRGDGNATQAQYASEMLPPNDETDLLDER
jgi:hypothetical protein